MLLSSKVTTQGLKETIVPCDLELEDYAFQFLIINMNAYFK
ncbi:hypothetical protein MANES_11G006275v8 [Manihot esculenta]|uniref:Uncharacterized protein n=1 Tax=Manihot esculenta TaxID=3983 RepID=A0ACB7GTX1_MANES|nr:hypothetical protein MANES_11G006275v8 [Manihot esculenta]